jgi:hypothetical protein
VPPTISADKVREALLALEGSVIEDFQLPLPGDLKDIAKAAALVSGIVEDRIPALLNSVRDRTWDEDGHLHAYEFRRFTIGFPDILLVERANPSSILFEMEAKSWYILSGDPLTARFETSPDVMRDGTIIAIAAWVLDGVVSGSPKLLRIYSDDAKRLATVRDRRWESTDENHRIIQPRNEPGTARNLIKTQTRGEIFSNGRWAKDAENFGKLDRLYDAELTRFRDDVWSLYAAGKSLKEWQTFITRRSVSARRAGTEGEAEGEETRTPTSRVAERPRRPYRTPPPS